MNTLVRVVARWALRALAVLLVACTSYATDPEIGIRLSSDQTAYVTGESATLTLYNAYRYPVLVSSGWCGLEADRWDVEGDEWVRAWSTLTFPCVGPLRELDSGKAVSTDFGWFVAEMAPGRYRFRYEVFDTHRARQEPAGSHDVFLVSNSFEIHPAEENAGS